MSAIPIPKTPVAPVTPFHTLYHFSVEQYDAMVRTGILGPNDRVELLRGEVVNKVSREPPHDGTLGIVMKLLLGILPAAWELRIQCAITLSHSKPEPDIAIVRGPIQQYMKRHPRVSDIGLLIEIADSSLMNDRRYKAGLYAEARLPEFWLINLVEGIVEVYTLPRSGKSPAYRQRRDYRQGEQVRLVLDGKEIASLAVSDLCPVIA
jgi:Uma2 family endonuclease